MENEQPSNLRRPGACLQVSMSGKSVLQSGTIQSRALRAEPTEWETTSGASFCLKSARGGLELELRLERGAKTAKRIQSSAKQHVTNLVSILSQFSESTMEAERQVRGLRSQVRSKDESSASS